MMLRFFSALSIRSQLMLLLLMALIPSLAIIVHTEIDQRTRANVEAEHQAVHLMEDLTAAQKLLVGEHRHLLGTLAELPEIRDRRSADCALIFHRLLTRYPHYVAIRAATPDGRVFAAAPSRAGVGTIADTKSFRDAIRTGRFSSGEYGVSALGEQVFRYAEPVLAADRSVMAVLQVEMKLEPLGGAVTSIPLPAGASVTIADPAGTILYRSFAAAAAVGHTADDDFLRHLRGEGEAPSQRESGAPVVVYGAVRSLPDTPPQMHIRLVIPEETVYGASRKTLERNLLLMLLVAGVALLLSNLVGKKSLAGPLEQLASLARRLKGGDLSVRSGFNGGYSEIGSLAHAFDDMAAALAAREEEKERSAAELQRLATEAVDAQARAAAIIAAIGQGISIQDPALRVVYQNDVHKSLVGECHGELCYQAYEGKPEPCDGCPVLYAFADGAVHTMDRSVQRPDGSVLHVEITASPVRGADGRIVNGIEVVRDITLQKTMEQELVLKNAALASSNHELQHFAYVTSHDLKEPLRTITSFIQLLKRRYGGRLDSNADEFMEFIVDGANRMQRLIDDLLLYARVGSQKKPFAPVDTLTVVRTVLANLDSAIADANASITIDELPAVIGDEGQLVQLFQNLVGNAIKFRKPAIPVAIRVGASIGRDQIRFDVVDNGIGIDPDSTGRIFEVFQKLHHREQYEGTGIGLAICKRIVERHGGTIWVTSVPGEGSTFSFTVRKDPA